MSATANKENQESDQAELQSVASPRISSTGAGGSEDPSGSVRATPPSARPSQPFPQGYDPHDMHHWGGMGQRQPHDTRSIASSAAADRDDKSIYDLEPGGLDAHTEGEEEDDDERDEDEGEEEEEEPQEINLTQDDMRGMQLRSESSNVESTYNAMSGPGSYADVADQLADQAVSPRQATSAIRSATRQQRASSVDFAGAEDHMSAGGAAEGGSPSASAAATAAFTVDGLSTDGSDSVSVSGVAHSSHSIEASQDGWQGGGTGGAAHGAAPGAGGHSEGAEAAGSSSGGADQLPMESIPLGGAEEEEPAAPAPQVADVDRLLTTPETKEEEPQPAAVAEEPEVAALVEEETQPPPQAVAAPTAAAVTVAAEQDALPVQAAAAEEDAAAAAPAEPVPRTTSNANYKSQLMQQLTASASEEDDLVVYSTLDASPALPLSAASVALQVPPAAARSLSNGAAAVAASAAAAVAAVPERPSRMEPLAVDSAGPSGSNNVNNVRRTMSGADTAAALAAINAAGGSSQRALGDSDAQQQQQRQQQAALLFPPAWYETFKGLLYMDGVDALGRPVVVLNADAVPADMKSSALVFVKAHLEPLVNQGDYVLVFTSRGHTKLPSMWIMGAYRSLPRPFRKHVQYIVLVRPSTFLRTVLAFMRPFVSKKAGRKIKQVQSVLEISEVTEGEVTVQSLGAAFNADLAADEAAAEAASGDPSP